MSKKAGLGKGLGAIFGENPTPMPEGKPQPKEVVEGTPQEIAVKDIIPNPFQPRQVFDEEKLQELAASIKEYGVVQPLVVRKKGKRYELVAGERRWRASQLVGLEKVPVIIRKYDDMEMLEIALIENIQRHDLNPIEEAQGLRRLMTDRKLTQEQVATKMGRSRAAVTNFLRLLNLPEEVQGYIGSGELNMGQAKQLLALPNSEQQLKVAKNIIEQGWSARMSEEVIRQMVDGKEVKIAREVVKTLFAVNPDAITKKEQERKDRFEEPVQDVFCQEFETNMVQLLGTKVKVQPKGKGKDGGKIEIEYYSDDDLARIYELLLQSKGQANVKKAPFKLHV